MNGKVYTLKDMKEICDIAKREYETGWWGIVVPEYLYDEIKVNSKEGNEYERLFAINVIINDDVVRQNGGHCMFVDEEFGRMLLNTYTIPYELYEEYVMRTAKVCVED
jgi:hypothetical protein